ncbi:MAG TPA: hypothetical protein VN868_03745 [Terriglobales bacterium]|nr:hypothetical protein [Terriglobales bacterium]
MISKTKHSPILAGVIFLVASSFLSGCGGGMHGGPGAAANPMKITPSSTTPRAGDSLQFSATNRNYEPGGHLAGQWSGGRKRHGRHHRRGGDVQGSWERPHPHAVTVQATSMADKSVSAGSSVTLQNPLPMLSSVSPNFLPVGKVQ